MVARQRGIVITLSDVEGLAVGADGALGAAEVLSAEKQVKMNQLLSPPLVCTITRQWRWEETRCPARRRWS